MAIVQRKLKKGGSSYWVVVTWAGKDLWRRTGRNKAEALRKEALWKRQIAEGTFSPDDEVPAAPRVREYMKPWLRRRANRTAEKDDSMMRLHVLPYPIAEMHLAEVKPRHVRELVAELRRKGLSDKSISNVLGTLRVMFGDAKRDEYTDTQPVDLPKRTLDRRRKKDPEIYQPAECRVLMTNQNIDARIRMLWTLLFCTGMREGEAVGRRWGDFQMADDLHALHVRDQYDREPLKTDNARVVPVHPLLADAMVAWRDVWPMLTGRQPRPDDFLVPGIAKPMMTRSSAYKWLRASCEAIRVPWRSLHSTRHTFITLARRGGADKAALETITHNARGGIVDGYTRSDWGPLCDVVRAVSFDSDQALALPGGNSGENPFLGSGESGHMKAATLPNKVLIGAHSAGFDSPRLHPKTSDDPDTSQTRTQGVRVVASSMKPAWMLAAAAHRLGVLPECVVTEQGVAHKAGGAS